MRATAKARPVSRPVRVRKTESEGNIEGKNDTEIRESEQDVWWKEGRVVTLCCACPVRYSYQ